MAVLDPGVEADPVAAAAQRGVERGDDRVALLVGRVAGGEVHHDVVLDGDEVATKRDFVGAERHTHRRGFDRCPAGVELRGVVPQDGHVADIAAGGQPVRDHGGASHLGPAGETGEVGHRRGLQRRATAQLRERLVGAAVGDERDAFHGAHRTWPVCAHRR